jgi:hypothetical protein
MEANEKARWNHVPANPNPPVSLKLKPAARRQYLLQVLRGRVPREPAAPPKSP